MPAAISRRGAVIILASTVLGAFCLIWCAQHEADPSFRASLQLGQYEGRSGVVLQQSEYDCARAVFLNLYNDPRSAARVIQKYEYTLRAGNKKVKQVAVTDSIPMARSPPSTEKRMALSGKLCEIKIPAAAHNHRNDERPVVMKHFIIINDDLRIGKPSSRARLPRSCACPTITDAIIKGKLITPIALSKPSIP